MEKFYWSIAIVLLVMGIYFTQTTTKEEENQKILVVSMVKNEEYIIKRMIKSVLHVIPNAKFLFCDTGSTDNTLSQLQGDYTIRIVNHTWENFEVNRNKCLSVARDLGERVFDYILFMDADQTLEGKFTRITADANTIQIRSNSTHNSMTLLIGMNISNTCKYELWTHELLQCDGEYSHAYYNDFRVVHHKDGSSYPIKHQRDIELLEKWLYKVNNPQIRPRALFHLAQAHHALEQYEKALEWYHKHLEVEKFTNYRFQSKYHIAKIILAQHKTYEEIEKAFLDALLLEYDGVFRWEPYYHLARISRQTNRITKCLMYSGAGVSSPSFDHTRMPLFIEHLIYHWKLELERAHCLFLYGRKSEAALLYKNILTRPLFTDIEDRVWLEKELEKMKF